MNHPADMDFEGRVQVTMRWFPVGDGAKDTASNEGECHPRQEE